MVIVWSALPLDQYTADQDTPNMRYQPCKLAPLIGHLSGKFEIFSGKCEVWSDMLTGLICSVVKHKLEKDKREGGLLM